MTNNFETRKYPSLSLSITKKPFYRYCLKGSTPSWKTLSTATKSFLSMTVAATNRPPYSASSFNFTQYHPRSISARQRRTACALIAGFERARGNYVLTLDADLQNPPEEILIY